MTIQTDQYSIKALFEQKQTFTVPKYQRSYAWEEESVQDFVEDIAKCLKGRADGNPKHHFFGGVVTVRKEVPGSTRDNYEIIDGQQRLSSFVMLIAGVLRNIESILEELGDDVAALDPHDLAAKKYLTETSKTLKGLFVLYRDNKGIEYVDVPKLHLSKADHEFFRKTISGEDLEPSRDSHYRITHAWKEICYFVDNKMFKHKPTASDKAAHIQQLVDKVLGKDCTVVFMCSDTRTEAYQIFQVLNDRGVQLGNGDLLRASTLELLDDQKLLELQNEAADLWDNILSYSPRSIDDFLLWYFSSVTGWRPKPSELADQFLEHRFQCKDKQKLTKKEADAVLKELRALDNGFAKMKVMAGGEWPYATNSGVKYWDRERLSILVNQLGHTNAMPLLLSLQTLDAKKFADAIAIIERFVFRYKTIGNAHISPATTLYLKHALKIRQTKKLPIKALRDDMNELIEKYVPDSVFGPAIQELRFSPKSGNSHIRYFLLALEDYLPWYHSGAQGAPKCKDKSRIFDISSTTIEHVYPQNAAEEDKVDALESKKQEIGNLSIAAPSENDKLGNKPFGKKRKAFQNSGLKLNRDIGENDSWTEQIVSDRATKFSEAALKIFRA